jgi:hypothetical protein
VYRCCMSDELRASDECSLFSHSRTALQTFHLLNLDAVG